MWVSSSYSIATRALALTGYGFTTCCPAAPWLSGQSSRVSGPRRIRRIVDPDCAVHSAAQGAA
jgi:hypothetical protein